MKIRMLVALSLVTTLVLASVAAAGARGSWHSVGKESANGDYAVAIASGTADHPSKLAVKITASPNQAVSGNWVVICSRGYGAGTKEGEFSGTTTLVKHMKMPYANPSSCTVSASAQLEGGGHLVVNLLAR